MHPPDQADWFNPPGAIPIDLASAMTVLNTRSQERLPTDAYIALRATLCQSIWGLDRWESVGKPKADAPCALCGKFRHEPFGHPDTPYGRSWLCQAAEAVGQPRYSASA